MFDMGMSHVSRGTGHAKSIFEGIQRPDTYTYGIFASKLWIFLIWMGLAHMTRGPVIGLP